VIIANEGQKNALKKIHEFINSSNRLLTISGLAGTGKTTLLSLIGNEFENAIICAPTNKAVDVLRNKGFKKATTLDKVLNKTIVESFMREPTLAEIEYWEKQSMPILKLVPDVHYKKIDADGEYQLVVVDEASMSSQDDIKRLKKEFPKVVCVGDGFQLPPVDTDPDAPRQPWFQNWQHDIVLTEIIRTETTSEIPLLAGMMAKKDLNWRNMSWSKEVTLLNRTNPDLQTKILECDQMLANQNITCDTYNQIIRGTKNLIYPSDPYRPVAGDRLLSWITSKDNGIVKSGTYEVISSTANLGGGYHVKIQTNKKQKMVMVAAANLKEQKSNFYTAKFLPFSFAHCITVHKSQGSEWDNVILFAGDKSMRHEDYWNWIYTGVTRAKKHLTIIL